MSERVPTSVVVATQQLGDDREIWFVWEALPLLGDYQIVGSWSREDEAKAHRDALAKKGAHCPCITKSTWRDAFAHERKVQQAQIADIAAKLEAMVDLGDERADQLERVTGQVAAITGAIDRLEGLVLNLSTALGARDGLISPAEARTLLLFGDKAAPKVSAADAYEEKVPGDAVELRGGFGREHCYLPPAIR